MTKLMTLIIDMKVKLDSQMPDVEKINANFLSLEAGIRELAERLAAVEAMIAPLDAQGVEPESVPSSARKDWYQSMIGESEVEHA